MMSKSNRSINLRIYVVFVLMSLLCNACMDTIEHTSVSVPHSVTILQGVDVNSLDPHYGRTLPTLNVLNHIFQTLTTQDQNNQIVPLLAVEWKVLEDNPRIWEFKLNPDAQFSDGTPVTSADVVYGWIRASAPEHQDVSNTIWNLITSMMIVKMDAIDTYTVQMETESPNPILPLQLTEYYIIPQHYYSEISDEKAVLHPLGSGPYQLKEWVRDDHLILVRNPNYWGEQPIIEEIIWRPVPNEATRLAELLSGNADLIDNLTPEVVTDLEKSNIAQTMVVTSGRRIYIGIAQYGHPALHDMRVRQALNYAIDFNTINNALLGGNGKRVATGVNYPWQNPKIEPYSYDPDQARALLAEAGYVDHDGDGFVESNGEVLNLTLRTPDGRYNKDKEITLAVGQYLEDIGIKIEVVQEEWSVYLDHLTNGEANDLFFMGSSSNFDGQTDLAFLEANTRANFGKWQNSKFQELFSSLAVEFDPYQRANIINTMQVLVKEEAPQIFLYFQVSYYGISNRLASWWQPYPNERIHLDTIH